ncbi:hypothetical protein A6A29_40815 [Streptomyces sp. TSRI0281]|nr:hypothetical protein A6A29_40815 [Streptomyces sp. TSRI0281]
MSADTDRLRPEPHAVGVDMDEVNRPGFRGSPVILFQADSAKIGADGAERGIEFGALGGSTPLAVEEVA